MQITRRNDFGNAKIVVIGPRRFPMRYRVFGLLKFRSMAKCWLLILVITGCTSGRPLRLIQQTPRRVSVLVHKIKDDTPRALQSRFSRIADRVSAQTDQLAVIGIFSRAQLLPVEAVSLRASGPGSYFNVLFQGRLTWGGAWAVFDAQRKMRHWFCEPRHRDWFVNRRDGILAAGQWELDRESRLVMFCYLRAATAMPTGWKSRFEKYVVPLKSKYNWIQILVFRDRLECRRFASQDNRRSQMLTAAISPVYRDSLLQPADTIGGYWLYRLTKKKGKETSMWHYVEPPRRQ